MTRTVKPTYSELLRDPRWQRKRLEIMGAADFTCQHCGDKTSTLNVHHRIYRKGAMPWEYSDGELICVCETCHQAEHEIRDAIAASLATMSLPSLEHVLGMIEGIEATARLHAYGGSDTFKMRSSAHVAGFLKALWAHVSPATSSRIKDLNQIDLREVEQLFQRGPVI